MPGMDRLHAGCRNSVSFKRLRRQHLCVSTVAIVGAGFMAETHAVQYEEMNVDVAGIVSRSGPDEFIDRLGLNATPYTNTETMCRELDVDFVDICTPTDTHLDLVRTAADASFDIFLEKPIAGSLAEAREIADLVADADVTCMVGHVLRYFPQYQAAKRHVDDGKLGKPGVARARRLSPFPDWGSNNWYADQDRSGGVFLDLAIHDLDYLRWVWGPVARVFARRSRGTGYEHGFVTLRFENGAVGYVESSWAQPGSRDLTAELELAGDGGLLEFDTDDEPYREFRADDATVESPVAKDGYRRQLEHFVDCIESGVTPDVTPADAIASLRLAVAAVESADRGEPVAPLEVDG